MSESGNVIALYWTFHNLDTKSHKILIITQCKILLWISIIKLIIFPPSYNSSIMPSIKYFYIFYHSISLAILLLSSSTIGTSSSNASCNSLWLLIGSYVIISKFLFSLIIFLYSSLIPSFEVIK